MFPVANRERARNGHVAEGQEPKAERTLDEYDLEPTQRPVDPNTPMPPGKADIHLGFAMALLTFGAIALLIIPSWGHALNTPEATQERIDLAIAVISFMAAALFTLALGVQKLELEQNVAEVRRMGSEMELERLNREVEELAASWGGRAIELQFAGVERLAEYWSSRDAAEFRGDVLRIVNAHHEASGSTPPHRSVTSGGTAIVSLEEIGQAHVSRDDEHGFAQFRLSVTHVPNVIPLIIGTYAVAERLASLSDEAGKSRDRDATGRAASYDRLRARLEAAIASQHYRLAIARICWKRVPGGDWKQHYPTEAALFGAAARLVEAMPSYQQGNQEDA